MKSKPKKTPRVQDVRDTQIKQLWDDLARRTRETIDLRDALDAKQMQMLSYATSNMELRHKLMEASVVRPSRDRRYLARAKEEARSSKDPSTQVGAVVVRDDGTVASAGYNGFPRGVQDSKERYADREFKLQAVVHAEPNAIVNSREPLHGMTMYTTLHPCAQCAALIVQAGIKRVVCEEIDLDAAPERWRSNMKIAQTILREGGVLLDTPKDC